ncbi:Flp family type IVb pilin [Sphingomonas lenta]|uniref:Flp family type IVb pilin n=1 Tax=Sphingomonas lenta TaxID=1141887 RepID=A0A2A2SH15_9SPHN|nr:Flp family type IVb pilin [Sphingomonas lenta]PAX08505.1 Flp family type IVb pilin [Sphingomonas lenta]
MRPLRPLLVQFRAFLEDKRGGTAIEYGLIAALIVIAMMSALSAFADTAIGIWNFVGNAVVDSDPTT